MIPVVGIDTLHSLTEQMSKLMQRQLCIEFSQVKMNLALIGKTITLTCLGLEMTYFSGLALVFLSRFQNTAVLTVISMHRNTHRLQMIYQRTTGLTVLNSQFTRLHRSLGNFTTGSNDTGIVGNLTVTRNILGIDSQRVATLLHAHTHTGLHITALNLAHRLPVLRPCLTFQTVITDIFIVLHEGVGIHILRHTNQILHHILIARTELLAPITMLLILQIGHNHIIGRLLTHLLLHETVPSGHVQLKVRGTVNPSDIIATGEPLLLLDIVLHLMGNGGLHLMTAADIQAPGTFHHILIQPDIMDVRTVNNTLSGSICTTVFHLFNTHDNMPQFRISHEQQR